MKRRLPLAGELERSAPAREPSELPPGAPNLIAVVPALGSLQGGGAQAFAAGLREACPMAEVHIGRPSHRPAAAFFLSRGVQRRRWDSESRNLWSLLESSAIRVELAQPGSVEALRGRGRAFGEMLLQALAP